MPISGLRANQTDSELDRLLPFSLILTYRISTPTYPCRGSIATSFLSPSGRVSHFSFSFLRQYGLDFQAWERSSVSTFGKLGRLLKFFLSSPLIYDTFVGFCTQQISFLLVSTSLSTYHSALKKEVLFLPPSPPFLSVCVCLYVCVCVCVCRFTGFQFTPSFVQFHGLK